MLHPAGDCELTHRISDVIPYNPVWCVTDGLGNYSNRAACTVQISAAGRIYSPVDSRSRVPMFDTEDLHDYILLNAVRYSGNGSALASPGINVDVRFDF